MPIDLLDILNTLIGSRKIRVTEERTVVFKKGISDISDPGRIVACVRTFLSYYPEDSLIEFCLERLFVNARPDNLNGLEYDVWQKEVLVLDNIIKSLRVPRWGEVLHGKMQLYCPHLVPASQ